MENAGPNDVNCWHCKQPLANDSDASTYSHCDFCETNCSDKLLRNVDNYAEDGTLDCKLICGDCVDAFASSDIEFNFSEQQS